MLVEHATLEALVHRLRETPKSVTSQVRLTPREHEVLVLMGQGLDPKAIAKRLGISLNTCRGHVQIILGKLEAHSQLEAVVRAVREGLIPGIPGREDDQY